MDSVLKKDSVMAEVVKKQESVPVISQDALTIRNTINQKLGISDPLKKEKQKSSVFEDSDDPLTDRINNEGIQNHMKMPS